MKKDDWIFGAGGGGSSQEPVRTPDNLLSQDFFEVLLAISEGPIKGLVSAEPGTMENFFAGDTPAYSLSSGTANFSDFAAVGYTGVDDDPEIELKLGGSSSNLPVNVALASAVDVVRQTPSDQRNEFDMLEFRILFNTLVRSNGEGTFESTAKLRISYKRASSGVWLDYEGQAETQITGKTTTGYVREFVIEVPRVNEDYDLRVRKISPDGVSGVDEDIVVLTWESVQMVRKGKVQYPGLSLMHIYGKASNQFSSVPEFSGVYDGMIVKVPTNYNAVVKSYDESVPWNGTFKDAYTDNPVWILYALITSTKYGLAKYYNGVTANRYEFYEEAKWCDQQVPDGAGGFQARFTFNEWINEARSGIELIRYVAGAFNGIVYDDGNGMISLRTDRPRTPVQIFTPENVSSDGFNYSFTDIPTRYNDITVTFINPDLDWEQDRRSASFDNTADIAKNGRIPYDFIAVGCTNAHEAVRRANQRYISANREVTTVNFLTSRFGLLTNLMDTVYIADPDADWSFSGRVKSVAGPVIQLRDPIFFSSLTARDIKVQTYSGIVTLSVVPPALGAVYSLQIIGGTWPLDVPDRTVFTVEDTTDIGLAKPFRVLSIEEVEGTPDKMRITALEVEVDKYPDSDSGTLSEPSVYAYTVPGEPILPVAIIPSSPPPLVNSDGTLQYRIELNWQRPIGSNTARYEIDFKMVGDAVWRTEVTTGDSAFLSPVRDTKQYLIRLYAVSPVGIRSAKFVQVSYTVVTESGTLPNVTGLDVVKTTNGWEIRWNDPTNISAYDGVEIKRGPVGTPYAELPVLYKTRNTSQSMPWLTAGVYRFHIKYKNRSGNSSAAAVTYDLTISIPATPILAVQRALDSTQIEFQDCETSQPLRDALIKTGNTASTFSTASVTGTAGAGQRLIQVVPSAVEITKVYIQIRDVAGNASNVAVENIPPAAGDIQELIDLIEAGISRDNLSPSLLAEIDLISADASVAGSVANLVAGEATARTLAIATETTNRNLAITSNNTVLLAAVNAGDVSTLAAAQSYAYSRAEADNAIAESIDALEATITGPGGPISAAVSTEASARAAVDGHLGAQWALKVALLPGGTEAEVSGIAIAGTSTPTAGARFDMSFRANAFFFLPPSGSGNTKYSPMVYYSTPQVVNGVAVPPGLYVRSAFIETVTADKIDARGLSLKDSSGNVILSAGTALDFSRINPSSSWLNSSITVDSNGALLGVGTAGVVVDNRQVGSTNLVWGAANGLTILTAGVQSQEIFVLKDGSVNPRGLKVSEKLSISAEVWADSTAVTGGETARLRLICYTSADVSVAEIAITNSTTSTARLSNTITLPSSSANIYKIALVLDRTPIDGTYVGTVRCERVQVQRGTSASQYGPGAEPGATVGAPAGTLVGGVPAETVATVATDFNSSNNRNAAAVVAPTISSSGTAVDHTISTDGAAQVSFEWSWAGTEGDIDGFQVFVRSTTSSSSYNFTGSEVDSIVYEVPAIKRAIAIYGVAADRYLTFGVRAYRRVDKDINATGVITSAIIQPALASEDPYRPSASVAFSGNLSGTISGVPVSTVLADVAEGKAAYIDFNASNNQNGDEIAAVTLPASGVLEHTTNADGSVNLSFDWIWGGDTADIDGFEVFIRRASTSTPSSVATTSTAVTAYIMPSMKRSFILMGVPANLYYHAAVRAYRRVNTSIDAAGVIRGPLVQFPDSAATPYRPSSTVAFSGDITGTVDGVAAATLVANAQDGATALAAVTNVSTGLSAKLSAAGADILTGPITMNAASAILVGTTTNGMYLGNTGLVAKKDGDTTLAITSAGDITIGGSASAATGYFAGALVAATGQFIGQVKVGSNPVRSGTTMTGSGAVINADGTFALGNATRNINFNGTAVRINGDLVVTENIIADGITKMAVSETVAQTDINDSGYQTIVEHTVTDVQTGDKLLVLVDCLLRTQASSSNSTIQLRLYVNGSTKRSFSLTDTTSSGRYSSSAGEEERINWVYYDDSLSGDVLVSLKADCNSGDTGTAAGGTTLVTLLAKR